MRSSLSGGSLRGDHARLRQRAGMFPERDWCYLVRSKGTTRGRLVQDVARVSGGLRARIERVGKLRPFGEVVAEQRLAALAVVRFCHPGGVAGNEAVVLANLLRGRNECDQELALTS